jgi:hypothetical protein
MKRSLRAGSPRSARSALAVLIGAFALGLAACSAELAPSAPATPPAAEAPVGPVASQPPSDLLGINLGGTLHGLLSNLTLYKCSTPSFGSVTQNVGPAGGVVKVGPHSLVIPAGALDRTVAITASTKASDHVQVDFQPEGLRFASPATLRLSYAHCPSRPLLPAVVYVDNVLSILELLPALNDLGSERVTTRLRHFSGYAIAD